ncbi:MAG: radical SAM protein [Patescibacteria group bacterium]|nr:radical SAM protein [Patescibacteria group bacterium]
MNYSNFYQKLLSFHSFIPYLLGKGKAWPPLRVQLELTYRCNLHCAMCYQNKKSCRAEMASTFWLSFIRQLPKFSLLTLIGGEPLLYPQFKEIAVEACRHPCNLVTNGVLLTEEMNQFLIDCHLLLIGVSLDGTQKVHDEMRGVKGTYEKVIKNLFTLQQKKKEQGKKFPLLDIKTVVTAENLDNLPDLAEVVSELKADFFTLSLPKVSQDQFNPCLKENFFELSCFDFSIFKKIGFEKFKKNVDRIMKMKTNSGTKIRFYPEISKIRNFNKNYYSPALFKQFFRPCQQPWSGIQVSAGGFVYPCLSLKVGDLKKKSFNQIWNGKEMVDFRKRLKRESLFSPCMGCCYLKQR